MGLTAFRFRGCIGFLGVDRLYSASEVYGAYIFIGLTALQGLHTGFIGLRRVVASFARMKPKVIEQRKGPHMVRRAGSPSLNLFESLPLPHLLSPATILNP